jgi:hypothetical protein
MNFLEILSFWWENGSHSEMRISECDKLPPLKGISSWDSGKVGLGVWAEAIRIDGIIEEMIDITLYESKILDNQWWLLIKEW